MFFFGKKTIIGNNDHSGRRKKKHRHLWPLMNIYLYGKKKKTVPGSTGWKCHLPKINHCENPTNKKYKYVNMMDDIGTETDLLAKVAYN